MAYRLIGQKELIKTAEKIDLSVIAAVFCCCKIMVLAYRTKAVGENHRED